MATMERSNLRLSDLKSRTPGAARLVSMKMPTDVFAAVDRLSKQLKASKTDVVVALLNEALAIAEHKTRQR